MNLVLTNVKCKSCSIKLTVFEADEKQGFCMDCFKEKIEEDKKVTSSS